jgi:hypothetical protein
MSTLGKICKAYPLQKFRQFPGWKEAAHNARKVWKVVDGEAQEVQRELAETDYLYLQENFTVTDGIFIGEHVIFSDVTPEWIEFCRTVLAFSATPEPVSAETDLPSQTKNSN